MDFCEEATPEDMDLLLLAFLVAQRSSSGLALSAVNHPASRAPAPEGPSDPTSENFFFRHRLSKTYRSACRCTGTGEYSEELPPTSHAPASRAPTLSPYLLPWPSSGRRRMPPGAGNPNARLKGR